MRWPAGRLRKTGGEYLSLLELKTKKDVEIAQVYFNNSETFGSICNRFKIRFGRELHMTDDAWRFTPTSDVLPVENDPRDADVAFRLFQQRYFVLHEGKTFWHYNDHWETRPRYLVQLTSIMSRKEWISAIPYFRALHRKVSSATNERTAVFCIVPSGTISGESCIADVSPYDRSNCSISFIIGIGNTFVFDWCARLLVCSNFSGYIRDRIPFPTMEEKSFVSHSCLRLTCNHFGFAPLWIEQLGDEWREPKPKHTWPVLEGDNERWAVRAAIDAVVAEAYGLTREQYAHVLSSFSHKSYPKAPELCLARFDELKAIGLDAFTKKHDPYWDIPLNESLPKPVIELPIPEGSEDESPKSGKKRRSRKAQSGIYKKGLADYGPLFNQSGNQS